MTTFTITVTKKDPNHALWGKGSTLAYVIEDGEKILSSGEDLLLTRGDSYIFEVDTPGHPFYLTTSKRGNHDGEYSIMGKIKPIDEGRFSFLVGEDVPLHFYYQCAEHEYMGGPIRVIDHHSLHILPYDDGYVSPIAIISAPGDEDNIYIADQIGIVYRVPISSPNERTIFLDLRSHLPTLQPKHDERGLLSIAFHPEYGRKNSPYHDRMYVFYSIRTELAKDNPRIIQESGHDHEITYYNCVSLFTGRKEEILLLIPKYTDFHNGGRIAFGPDGDLYICVGDGGPQGDPYDHAQSLSTIYGKILRLDVDVARGEGYAIPEDNPFLLAGNAKEIYAYGFRNPWGISWNEDGQCVVVDVGWDTKEEVNVVVSGGNYGWRAKEGSLFTGLLPVRNRVSYIDPVFEYTHEWLYSVARLHTDSAIIGGYSIPGKGYVFGDYGGVIMRIQKDGMNRWVLVEHKVIDEYVLAFGEDNDGTVYVATTSSRGLGGKNKGRIYIVET